MKFFNWGGSNKVKTSVLKSGDFQQLQTSGMEQQKCRPKAEYNYSLFGHQEEEEKHFENLFAIGTIGDTLINDPIIITDDDYYSYYICGLGAVITHPNEPVVGNTEPVAEPVLPVSAVVDQSPTEPVKKQSLLRRFGKALRPDIMCRRSNGQKSPKKTAKPDKHSPLPVLTPPVHHKSKLAKFVEVFHKGKRTKVCPDPASTPQIFNYDPNPVISFIYTNEEAMSSSSFPTLLARDTYNINHLLQHSPPQQEEKEEMEYYYYSDEEEEEKEGNTDNYSVYGSNDKLDYNINRQYWIHSDDEFVVLEM